MHPLPSRSLRLGASLAAVSPLAVLVPHFWPFTVDDTFITLRYARNLSHGDGLTWNPGGGPVEGYTSLLWTLLMTPAHWLVDDAEGVAKGLGVACTLATALVTARLSRRWAEGARAGAAAVTAGPWVAAFLVAVIPWTAAHAVSGMDTALFTVLLTALSLAFARAVDSPGHGRLAQVCGLGLCTTWARPEGAVAFAAASVALLVLLPRGRRWPFLGWGTLLFAAPEGAHVAWRIAHYGLLFPLPFYVKAIGQKVLLAGLPEALEFLSDLTWLSPLFALALLVGLAKAPRALVPALAGGLGLALFLLKPAPLMAYDHRYLYPLLPLLASGAGAGAERAARWLSKRMPARFAFGAPFAALSLGTMVTCGCLLPGDTVEKLEYAAGLRRAHVALGKALAAEARAAPAAPGSEPRVALLDAGAVAYYSNFFVIDTFGLNEPHIAQHGRGDAGYVLSQRPDVLVLVSRGAARFQAVFDYEASLYEAARAGGYADDRAYEFTSNYFLWVLRRGAPAEVAWRRR